MAEWAIVAAVLLCAWQLRQIAGIWRDSVVDELAQEQRELVAEQKVRLPERATVLQAQLAALEKLVQMGRGEDPEKGVYAARLHEIYRIVKGSERSADDEMLQRVLELAETKAMWDRLRGSAG